MAGNRNTHLPRPQGSSSTEMPIHQSFAALECQEHVYHAENNIEKSADGEYAAYYCKAERGQPQNKKYAGNLGTKQTEQEETSYACKNPEVSTKIVGVSTPKITPYATFRAWRVFDTCCFGFQAIVLGYIQLLKQLLLQTFAHCSVRTTSNVNSTTEIASAFRFFNPDAPFDIENPNHA